MGGRLWRVLVSLDLLTVGHVGGNEGEIGGLRARIAAHFLIEADADPGLAEVHVIRTGLVGQPSTAPERARSHAASRSRAPVRASTASS